MKKLIQSATLGLCILTAALPGDLQAAKESLKLGSPFGNRAILQREMPVPIWGWAKPGTKVVVKFAGQNVRATADDEGKWQAELKPLKANAEAQILTVSSDDGSSVTLEDVLVGEVWLASGQSNMQWIANKSSAKMIVEELKKATEAANGKAIPIREFKVTNYFAHLHPIEHAEGEWSQDYGNFSAVALAFAHKLYGELGIPIGILNCSFSQTKIEAWTPRIGYADSKSDYNKKIEAQLLRTDPSTEEHKKDWGEFYTSVMDVVQKNQEIADSGDNQFVSIPNKLPGNMGGNRDATWLFNARLNPVIPYGLRGGIWNQGYANMGGGLNYYDNLHAMIRGWRKLWKNPELPVYFHQFYSPGNGVHESDNHPSVGSTAEMRLGTWLARDIPHTGMASQIDIQGAIHYGNKSVPGQRLALHALKNEYAKDIVADGPMYKGYEVKGNQLIITFDHAEGGLVVADTHYNTLGKKEDSTGFADPKIIENGAEKVRLFYLVGEDRIWHPAQVKIDGEKAVVTSKAVPKPKGVAYGTGGIGFQPNLYNKALLPTTPFIVYDQKLVTKDSWPDSPIKIAGVEIDPSTVGLIYEYRKMPILSTQFRDNAVLQADQPITFWGGSIHDWGYEAKGEAVIHFRFGEIKETIPVKPGMKEWKLTVPAMPASDKPMTLEVKFTIDGKLAHERIIKNILIGDVWYVAGIGKQPIGEIDDEAKGPIRIMTRKAKGVKHKRPRPYSVATSTTPKNRFASYWSTPTGDGFAAGLAKAIHAKTGKPVGIIYMDEDNEQLKHWMNVPALANASSLKTDYEDIAAVTPGTPFYKKNAEAYIAAWKTYWGEYIPAMISSKAVPDDSSWGSYPQIAENVETDACQVFNCLIASFKNTQVKGMVFMTEESSVAEGDGTHFGDQMGAIANSWKAYFKGAKDPHFVYTIPAKSLVPKITKPSDIKGANTAFELGAWPEKDQKGNYGKDANPAPQGLIEAVIKAAY